MDRTNDYGDYLQRDVPHSYTNHLESQNAQLRADLEQVKTERDAAVEDLKGMCEVLNSCAFCIHDLRGTNENWPTIHCNNKDKRKCWRWRGLEGRADV